MAGASPGPVFPRLSGFFKADRNVRFEKPDSHAELIVPVDIGGWPIEINRRCESVNELPTATSTQRGHAPRWGLCSLFLRRHRWDCFSIWPLVRYEKMDRSFLALNHLAAAIMAFIKIKLDVNIIYG